MPTKQIRKRWDDSIYRQAEALLSSGHEAPSAAHIARQLADANKDMETTPTPRTIADWISTGRIRRRDDRWTITDGTPEDVALVLETLAALAEQGQREVLYRDDAEALVRIRRMFPDLEATEAFRVLVVVSFARAHSGRSLYNPDDLALALGFMPWRDQGARYLEAYAAGRLGGVYFDDLPGARPAVDAMAARAARKREVRDAAE